MPSPPKTFDVWFVAANTVYKAVPYHVVADWTGQGRLAPSDQVRPAGSSDPWQRVDSYAVLRDYAPRAAATVAVVPGSAPAPVNEEDLDPLPHRHKEGEDDDVDMIPLIDISMVLLVFFIMMQAAGALSPVDVPDMKYAGKLTDAPNAITINIERRGETVYYALRVGELAPKPEHDNLPNPEKAIDSLDELLKGRDKPPEVRIACRKDLPSERVFELLGDLKKRQEKGQINSFCAEVNEAPQEK